MKEFSLFLCLISIRSDIYSAPESLGPGYCTFYAVNSRHTSLGNINYFIFAPCFYFGNILFNASSYLAMRVSMMLKYLAASRLPLRIMLVFTPQTWTYSDPHFIALYRSLRCSTLFYSAHSYTVTYYTA
jgi:hypothetical protein